MNKVEVKKDNSVRNMIVGAAVVGAGVVAATVLSKKENREKIGKAITDVGDKGKKVVIDIKEKIKNVEREFNYIKGNIQKSTEKSAEELKKEVDSISVIVEEIKTSNKENVSDLIDQVKVSMRNLRKDFDKLTSK